MFFKDLDQETRWISRLAWQKAKDQSKQSEILKANSQVLQLLDMLVSKEQFVVGDLRREVSKYIFAMERKRKGVDVTTVYKRFMAKANGMDVEDMYTSNPEVFGTGRDPVPQEDLVLRPDRLEHHHRLHCLKCKHSQSECYFPHLLKCITHGWLPAFSGDSFIPPYEVSGNYPVTKKFSESVSKEIATMEINGVIQKCQALEYQVIHPTGAVIKNSDKMKASTLVHVPITDQSSLNLANSLLKDLGLNPIKVRVSTDCTATGVNGASFCPRFSYPSIQDAVRILKRGCWLGAVDVGRYFNSFPWSLEMRPCMRFEWNGDLYEFIGLCFGFSVCPYYCSTWSAEFRMWMNDLQVDCTHMVDDWLFVADSLDKAKLCCENLASILEDCGFYMAIEKNVYGQSIKFLGVLLDTVNMTMRIEPVQAKGTRLMLESCLIKLRAGQPIPETDIRHLAGKLNWFSELIQSGRLHTQSWWEYLRRASSNTDTLSICARLNTDILWWIDILRRWEEDKNDFSQYKILSANELMTDKYSIYYLQSDASGVDGFGYFHGFKDQTDLDYFSSQWNTTVPTSTHVMELTSLDCFMTRSGSLTKDKVLVWITDSTSAALTINKGSCKKPEGQELLHRIYERCDNWHTELVAVWCPREENILADYLSHLSALSNRKSCEGKVSDL